MRIHGTRRRPEQAADDGKFFVDKEKKIRVSATTKTDKKSGRSERLILLHDAEGQVLQVNTLWFKEGDRENDRNSDASGEDG